MSNRIQHILFNLLKAIKFLPSDIILTNQLDFAHNVAKRLDEHRELIEDIENHTGYFTSKNGQWSRNHAITQDDYLIKLFILRYSVEPTKDNLEKLHLHVRERPHVLKSQE
ncbi:hypothetical protein GNP61_08155 [Aliivibrio fischeri]|uniref:hypothetical protein n=1 Tax=Aliivibrio fischeri TaxID=668 RepID=UPI0012DAF47E|nr:hypothetical protein [Aliivibrio fischeri]MUK41533.1 hypothetical protein [Aliivibrio fischeri]